MNVICLMHPSYDRKSVPNLSCKVCCGLYIAEIRNEQIPVEWKPQLSESSHARISEAFDEFKKTLQEKLDEVSRNSTK